MAKSKTRKAEELSAAKDLYMCGWNQDRIAEALDCSTTTISKWVNENGWQKERIRKYDLVESNAARIMDLIDYQIEALKKITDTNRDNHNLKLLEKGDIDALSKLFSTIKGREIAWTMYVDVIRETLEYVSLKNPELARQLIPHTDAFLIFKRERIIS